jgi:hypothetical protein
MSADLNADRRHHDTGKFAATFFFSPGAPDKREERLHAHELAERIRNTTQKRKDLLPWLKLARFGGLRTDKGSLRHDGNVIAITGIEGDYDGEQMSFEVAEDVLNTISIHALLYTSPSHTENAPRWRVLCPLSREYSPDRRDDFMARLNGAFGGIFSRESWALSQSYYFGAVNKNPPHRVAVIEGVCVDLADNLDEGAVGRPRKPKPNGSNGQHHLWMPQQDSGSKRVAGLTESLLNRVRTAPDGNKHHTLRDVARALGGYLHLTDWTEAQAIDQLIAALPTTVCDWDGARCTAEWGVREGLKSPLGLEDRPQYRNGHRPAPPPNEPSQERELQHPTNDGSTNISTTVSKHRRSHSNVLALVTHINTNTVWSDALSFNLLTENYEVCMPFPPQDRAKGPSRPLRDPHDILTATMYFQANGFPKATKNLTWDALAAAAHQCAYHPARDYLSGLRWDGIDRVGELFRQYFNAELPDEARQQERDRQLAYLEHISTGFMVGAVARVMDPGCKQDHVPVVVGRERSLKSTAIRELCPNVDWFSDDISTNLIDRDTKESLAGKWIIELAEIPHIRRETERMKAFFSRRIDRYRSAYGKANQDHPRQCVFVGTSNDLEFVDVTGNRRFWPFRIIGLIDIAAIVTDRDQLWAEALTLYRRGVHWWLAPNIETIAAEQQASFVETDIWEDLIASWISRHPTPFTMEHLFAIDTGFTPYREASAVSKADQMRAGRCLTKLGMGKRQQTIDGKRSI